MRIALVLAILLAARPASGQLAQDPYTPILQHIRGENPTTAVILDVGIRDFDCRWLCEGPSAAAFPQPWLLAAVRDGFITDYCMNQDRGQCVRRNRKPATLADVLLVLSAEHPCGFACAEVYGYEVTQSEQHAKGTHTLYRVDRSADGEWTLRSATVTAATRMSLEP
jgi:hypothetical protein